MSEATVEQTLAEAAARLRAAGVEAARRDASLLLGAALGSGADALRARPERPVDAAASAAFAALVDRRVRREPVSRILGHREFWSLPFKITPATLDPRPDSETVVAAVLARIGDRSAPLAILDLGTGSGCLLLALLAELPAARGLGIDICAAALRTARENAVALGLAGRAEFVCGAWAAAVAGAWQVIVSNPPYIVTDDLRDLAPEVQGYDPRLALDGGADGLAAYRALAPDIARLIAPGGLAALEIETARSEAVENVLRAAGLSVLGRERDLSGRERCVLAGPGTAAVARRARIGRNWARPKKVVGKRAYSH
jgi:release factor glutamine methyltransferase